MFLLIVVRRQEKLQTDMTLGVQLRPPTSEILLEHHSAMVPHEGFNETPHYEGLKVTPNYIERIFFFQSGHGYCVILSNFFFLD